MSKVILVTGSSTLTGRKLIAKLLERNYFVVTPVAGKEKDRPETGTKNLSVFSWNKSSWFSTKALIREIVRRHRSLDAVFIVHDHIPARLTLEELESTQVENVLEESVKSNVALVRELAVLPVTGGSDHYFLGMIVPHNSGGSPGALDALANGAFSSFASAVVRSDLPGWWSCGFVNRTPDADGFTGALIEQWEKRPRRLRGKWFRYAEGKRPFGGSGIVNTVN